LTFSQSEEEVRRRSVECMGESLGELYFLLWKEVAWVHVTWVEYRRFFAAGQSTFDLLNATAPMFFYRLDYLMWHDIILHLCRLTDPPTSAGKNNVTLLSLSPKLDNQELQDRVKELAEDAKSATDFARDWRNRHIAHRSLSKAANPLSEPLEIATREKVDSALKSIRRVMNALESHFNDSETQYDQTQAAAGGAAALLSCLRKATAPGEDSNDL